MNVRNPRFALFDSLRGIAALGVFAFHAAYFSGALRSGALAPWLTQLNAGVAVFFVISGFLLYRPFAQARLEGGRPPALVPFALRRFLRIVPAYWLALVVIALWLGLPMILTAARAPIYLSFLQVYDARTNLGAPIGQAWTLCVEVTFYALLPAWAALMRRIPFARPTGFLRSELVTLAALFGLGLAWKVGVLLRHHNDAIGITPALATLPAFLDHFAVGMGLAVLSVALAARDHMPAPIRLVERAPWIPWLGAACAFLAAGALPGAGPAAGARFLVNHELRALVALGLILPAVFGDRWRDGLRRLLASRLLLWLGVISYSLYLWHVAIIDKLSAAHRDLGLGWPATLALALGLSVAVAAASWYGVERYALALGRRLTRRRDDGRPAESLAAEPVRRTP